MSQPLDSDQAARHLILPLAVRVWLLFFGYTRCFGRKRHDRVAAVGMWCHRLFGWSCWHGQTAFATTTCAPMEVLLDAQRIPTSAGSTVLTACRAKS